MPRFLPTLRALTPAEAEEAGTDIPEQGSVSGRGDGSIPSAGSSTPEADISTATAPPAGGSASAPAP
jgi:hypothetical protein